PSSGRWRPSTGAAVTSTTLPWSNASPLGNGVTAPCLPTRRKPSRKGIRAESPECEAIQSHVLQDAPARLDKTYQAFFLRAQRGEKAGFHRFKGRTRCHSFTV